MSHWIRNRKPFIVRSDKKPDVDIEAFLLSLNQPLWPYYLRELITAEKNVNPYIKTLKPSHNQ
jgi:hypothetical protein